MCDLKHGVLPPTSLFCPPMEWMLQVVDEVDDAIGAVKHRWLGLTIELGVMPGFGITMAVVGAAFTMGLGAAK
jgi:hypothetical protein